jgi:hypothetical protein
MTTQKKEEITLSIDGIKKCGNDFCNNECETDEYYCLRCDKLVGDARQEQLDDEKEICEVLYGNE